MTGAPALLGAPASAATETPALDALLEELLPATLSPEPQLPPSASDASTSPAAAPAAAEEEAAAPAAEPPPGEARPLTPPDQARAGEAFLTDDVPTQILNAAAALALVNAANAEQLRPATPRERPVAVDETPTQVLDAARTRALVDAMLAEGPPAPVTPAPTQGPPASSTPTPAPAGQQASQGLRWKQGDALPPAPRRPRPLPVIKSPAPALPPARPLGRIALGAGLLALVLLVGFLLLR